MTNFGASSGPTLVCLGKPSQCIPHFRALLRRGATQKPSNFPRIGLDPPSLRESGRSRGRSFEVSRARRTCTPRPCPVLRGASMLRAGASDPARSSSQSSGVLKEPPSAGTEQSSPLHLCSARDVSASSRGAVPWSAAPWVPRRRGSERGLGDPAAGVPY